MQHVNKSKTFNQIKKLITSLETDLSHEKLLTLDFLFQIYKLTKSSLQIGLCLMNFIRAKRANTPDHPL